MRTKLVIKVETHDPSYLEWVNDETYAKDCPEFEATLSVFDEESLKQIASPQKASLNSDELDKAIEAWNAISKVQIINAHNDSSSNVESDCAAWWCEVVTK